MGCHQSGAILVGKPTLLCPEQFLGKGSVGHHWQPILLVAEEMSISVLKGNSVWHTTASTTVYPLHHLDLLPFCSPSLHLGIAQGFWMISFPGKTFVRKGSRTNYSPHCFSSSHILPTTHSSLESRFLSPSVYMAYPMDGLDPHNWSGLSP